MKRREELIDDLSELGVSPGDLLLVHSSFKSLGPVDGGPEEFIAALMHILGDEGTLIMPSFLAGSEYAILLEDTPFDLVNTPSQMGIISEIFRSRDDVRRSLNATHSVAVWGKDAEKLIEGHERCSVSVGRASPFEKLIERRGKILLLGADHAANTTLHYVENVHGAPSLSRNTFTGRCIDAEGQSHETTMYAHMPGLLRNYMRVDTPLSEAGLQVRGKVAEADARLVDAHGMNELIGGLIREDPLYLIEVFTP